MVLDEIGIQNLRKIRRHAVLMYFSFLNSNKFFDLIKSPITPERVYYELIWTSDVARIIDPMIFLLSEFEIIEIQGETICLGKKYNEYLSVIKRPNHLGEFRKTAVYSFIKYGLSLVQEKIDGGSGDWNYETHLLILEHGMFAPTFTFLQGVLTVEIGAIKKNIPDIAIYGPGIEAFATVLSKLVEDPSHCTILAISKEGRERAHAFLELEKETSLFSPNVGLLTDIKNKEFDLLFVNSIMGTMESIQDWPVTFYNLVKRGGRLIVNVPALDRMMTGLEPLFLCLESLDRLHKIEEIKKYLRIAGFKNIEEHKLVPSLLICSK